jgi:ribosome-binding factor A
MATDRRRQQVSRVVQQRLAQIFLKEMKDPRASFVTITEVAMNKDLTVATVHWSALKEEHRKRLESLLRHARGFLRTEVAHELDLRNAPILEFKYDDRLERMDRMEKLIRENLPQEEKE